MLNLNPLVVIHAQFLKRHIWHKVMWGDPKNGVFGSITYGLMLAAVFQAKYVYFCSGIPAAGRKISPNAFRYTTRRKNELTKQMRSVLQRAMIVQNVTAQTTIEEVRDVAAFAEEHHNRLLISVTFPKHGARVSNTYAVAQQDGAFRNCIILPTWSAVNVPGTTARSVSLLENRHRDDGLPFQWGDVGNGMVQVMRQGREANFWLYRNVCRLLQHQGVDTSWAGAKI